MARKVIHVALNGVTGRMGYRQHLVRSLLAIREQGGLPLGDGTMLYPEPILVGRSEERLPAIAAGKHVYTEKPVAASVAAAFALADAAKAARITHGVVQDKLFLPGMIKLRRLIREGFFGRVLSGRLVVGYL